ncbi:sigma-E factor negative regulatory protein [endosymbiont of unidentified scaly snail isolate Monju]|uniref:sigma-E factor negative regulatory protein n=1 Tax=endosymbiont of unidentified scaly snail isolate Monju TaxID=1248727 RepID=UPI0005B8F6F3|nr:sigma-E factor negative regulatory protein [endosymbiont of unidentified scaly snail isolate Monju]
MNTKRDLAGDERYGERLSAFLDGELSAREMERMAAELAGDRGARQRYERYAQVAAHIAGDGYSRVDASGIAERVSQALNDEPAILAPRQWRDALRVPRLALGAALAAGVAVLAVAVAPQMIGIQESAPLLPETQTFAFAPHLSVPADGFRTVSLQTLPVYRRPLAAERAATQPVMAGHWKTLKPAMREKLVRYLLQHNEVAGQIAAQQPSAHLSFVSNQHDRP